ncbi:MAG: hypothetical protein U0414_22795 [Polyangiaceae bacterium]
MYKLLVAGLASFVLAGCAYGHVEGIDDPPATERPAQLHPRLEPTESVVPIAFATRDGSWVLTDVEGQELARTPSAGLGGEVDATYDPIDRVLTTFEASAVDEGGELWRYELSADRQQFLTSAKFKKVEGTARLATTALGTVLFEENIGARWKVFLRTGKGAGSVPSPRPSSVAIVEGPERAEVISLANLPEDDTWARVAVGVGAGGWGAESRSSLTDLGLVNPRLVMLPDGREIAVGVKDGEIGYRALGADGEFESTGALGEGLSVATHAFIPRPDAEDAAVLVSLAVRPTRLVVSWWWSEEGVSALRTAWVDLPGELRVDDRSISRDIAVLGDHVLAATSAGAFRVDVSFAGGNVVLTRAPFGAADFAATLAGPITPLDDPS